jgi:hypothetical protein
MKEVAAIVSKVRAGKALDLTEQALLVHEYAIILDMALRTERALHDSVKKLEKIGL